MLYKQHSITHKIPSGKFEISDLRKFVEVADKIHEDCSKQLKQDIQSGEFLCAEINSADASDIDLKIAKNFKIMIEIFGDDGEYLNVLKLSEITSEVDLPHKFSKIRIGNSPIFEHNFKKKPSIYFDAVLDFSTTRVFDLISTPSRSTSNDSQIRIVGQSTTTVQGIACSLEKFFNKHKSHHGIVHAENVYDALLWFGFFPLLLIYLFKYHSKIPESISMAPVLFQVLVALTLFFILALSFRLIFNLGRWFFPYLEIKDQTSHERKVFKAIYSIVVAAIIGAIGLHISTFFWEALTK